MNQFTPSEEALKFFASKKSNAEVTKKIDDLKKEQVFLVHNIISHEVT